MGMSNFSRRELGLGAIGALATLGIAARGLAQAGAAAGPGDGLAAVHPELRAAAEQMLKQAGSMPPPSDDTLADMRKGMSSFGGPPLAAPAFEKVSIPVGGGAPAVTAYVINARQGGSRPAILHTHGGGYVLGTALQSVPNMQRIAAALDCVIVTVDYRLAPETGYRGSIEDNYAGLKWLHANADRLGVDRKRLAVMGESAGGGHAALLALTARDRGEVPLVLQVLIYPMLDDRTGTSRAVPGDIGKLLWTKSHNHFGWRAFLGQEPGTANVPAAAVPSRRTDLKGLPPAFIGVGAIDLFVDEDVDYARRLIDAGVPTELIVVPGAFHAFDSIAADSSISQQFTAAKLTALRRAFRAA